MTTYDSDSTAAARERARRALRDTLDEQDREHAAEMAEEMPCGHPRGWDEGAGCRWCRAEPGWQE